MRRNDRVYKTASLYQFFLYAHFSGVSIVQNIHMDYSKPTLLVISGPNGAGKSTHIQTMLPDPFEGIFSFDRDQTRVSFESELKLKGALETEITPHSTRMMEEKFFFGNEKSNI